MGGMMGGMLGQMIRPFNLEVFMPFFTFIVLISLASLSYAVHCGCSGCCTPDRRKPVPVSNAFGVSWLVGAFVILAASVVLSFPLPGAEEAIAQSPSIDQSASSSLPPALQQFVQEIDADAVVKDGLQTADILISQSRYTPNVIRAKEGIPLRLNFRADETAGCARDVVFPDFSIRKIVPEGSTTTIELNFDRAGTYPFRCSMDMARGKVVVE
jgi:heme/copper-type cytochrome/quinol oxidase subunit 2